MSGPEYTVGSFVSGRDDPTELARLHLEVRQRQEAEGENKFSDIFDSQADIGNLKEYYIAPGGNFFVAREIGGEVMGFVGLRHDGHGYGSLKRMATVFEYRNRGVATALVSTTIDWAKDRGFTKLTLHTNQGEAAKPRYEAAGFEIVGFLPEKGLQGDYIMELNLQKNT